MTRAKNDLLVVDRPTVRGGPCAADRGRAGGCSHAVVTSFHGQAPSDGRPLATTSAAARPAPAAARRRPSTKDTSSLRPDAHLQPAGEPRDFPREGTVVVGKGEGGAGQSPFVVGCSNEDAHALCVSWYCLVADVLGVPRACSCSRCRGDACLSPGRGFKGRVWLSRPAHPESQCESSGCQRG